MEKFERILPYRLEHAVATLVAGFVGMDERRQGQFAQHGLDHPGLEITLSADILCSEHRPTAGEDGEPPKQSAFLVAQQVVAPVECRAQRLLPGQGSCIAACQHADALIKAIDDRRQRPAGKLRGGKLDGQGNTVKPGADPRNLSGMGGGKLKAWNSLGRARTEEPD